MKKEIAIKLMELEIKEHEKAVILIDEIKKKSVRGMSLSSYTLEKLVFFLTAE